MKAGAVQLPQKRTKDPRKLPQKHPETAAENCHRATIDCSGETATETPREIDRKGGKEGMGAKEGEREQERWRGEEERERERERRRRE